MAPEKTPTNPRGAGRKLKLPEDKYKGHHIKFMPAEWGEIVTRSTAEGISASEYVRKKALE